MRLCHFDFSKPLELLNGVGVLVVEHTSKFIQYCRDFLLQQEGKDGDFIWDDEGKTVSFKKEGAIVFDFFGLSLCDKKIIAGLYAQLNKTVEACFSQEYADLAARLIAFADLLNLESPVSIEYDAECTVPDLLKALKVQPQKAEKPFAEKIASWLDAQAEFVGVTVFVLVNARAYLEDSDFKLLLEHISYAPYSVLFLEKAQGNRVAKEPIRIMDHDLCEIIVE